MERKAIPRHETGADGIGTGVDRAGIAQVACAPAPILEAIDQVVGINGETGLTFSFKSAQKQERAEPHKP